MNEIKNAMAEHGLDPGDFPIDGKVHRFKVETKDHKKSGWVIAYQNFTRKSGEIFYVAVYGNLRIAEKWTYQSNNVKLTADDKKALKEQVERARKLEEQLREKVYVETADEVQRKWDELKPALPRGDYFLKKGLSGCTDLSLRADEEGNIYAPMRDIDGRLWSWQQINGRGEKWFHAGGRVSGCFHLVGDLGANNKVLVCEGVATAASLRLATGLPVVVAFTANNLVRVSGLIKRRHAHKSIVVCGDDDRWKDPTRNPGRECAEEAAKGALGTVVVPRFRDDTGRPTDFNDLHAAEGLAEVERQVMGAKENEKSKLALFALGYGHGVYYFTSTVNKQINPVTSFSEDAFLKLMPIEYWESVFPGAKSRVDWQAAKSELIAQCHQFGVFDQNRVRGAGVWEDQGRVVINMGDHLVVDGVKMELQGIRSRFRYELCESLEELRDDPLTVKEARVFVDACQMIKWARPKDAGILLAGTLVCARVCGALPVRPHLWLTGGAQTGKTSIQQKLVEPIMGKNALSCSGGTSEAGLRQRLRNNAVPILFDEFESEDADSQKKIASCIELMRGAWSNGKSSIIKGGQNGVSTSYQMRFAAIVSSIRTRLINDADKGRFAVVELAPHGSDENHWRDLSALLAQIDDTYSERLFARVVRMLPVLLSNYRRIKRALARRADARFGDQYGMILAGYSVLIHDDEIDDSDADFLADHVDLSEEKEQGKVKDEHDALHQLTTTLVSYGEGKDRREKLIGEAIKEAWRYRNSPVNDAAKNALLNLGIRVDADKVVIVGSTHAQMERHVWRGTKWSQAWGNSLARVEGAEKRRFRVGPNNKPSILIPIHLFDVNTEQTLNENP